VQRQTSPQADRLVFAANLDALRERFGTAAFVSVESAAEYLKMHPETLRADATFPLKAVSARRRVVPVVQLARWLSV
jgi:hypothetical protein